MKTCMMLGLMALSMVNAQMSGGWSDGNVSETSSSLFNAIKKDSNYADEVGSQRICVTKIHSVEQQVVSGMNYRFHVDGCLVDATTDDGSCPKDCTKKGYVIQVYDQPWTHKIKVTGINSEDHRQVSSPTSKGFISTEEKALIHEWIKANGLNEFGDKEGTIYLGGTPLFDENTGTQVDLYDYILRQHPDRPWNKHENIIAQPVNLAAQSPIQNAASSHGMIAVVVFSVFGVMIGLVAMVASIRSRRTQHRFRYNALHSRDI